MLLVHGIRRPTWTCVDHTQKVPTLEKSGQGAETSCAAGEQQTVEAPGEECERQHKSLATAGAGQLEALLTCLRADPSSARVAAHCINRTLHPVPRKSKKKQSAVESRDKDKNDKNSRPQSTRLQPTRHHAER